MKKNLLYVLMMACMFAFFTACGDDGDDDEPKTTETTWKDGAGSYTKGTLTINSAEAKTTQTLKLESGSGDNAKMTISNVVPEENTLVFDDVTMTKSSSNYTFSSEKKVGTTTITLAGTLKGIPTTKADATPITMEVTVTRKIDSSVAGEWHLGFAEGEVPVADFRIDSELEIAGISPMVGGLIGAKVSDVIVKLNDNGIFDVSWVQQGSGTAINFKDAIKAAMAGNSNIPEAVLPLIDEFLNTIGYYTVDNTFYLALDKTIVDAAALLMGALMPEGMDFNAILKIFMEEKGNYYVMPIGMELKDNTVFFYLEKEKVLAAFEVISPLLEGLVAGIEDPATAAMVKGILEQLPPQIAGAEKFNLGLGFTK